ncbi:MAG: VanZ family protein [bacterium]|nr:VanZ family protein [bacterium]
MDLKTNTLYKNTAVCFTLFLIYACLVPFHLHFSFAEVQHRFHDIRWIPYFINGRRTSLTDLASNIALFMPFGFLTAGALHGRIGNILLILRVILLGFVLSALLELFQLFTVIRVSSVTDVCNNTLGALIGSIFSCVYHNRFGKSIKPFLISLLKKPLPMLYAYSIFFGILFYQLMPFDFTLDLGDIKDAVKFSLSHTELFLQWDAMQSSGNNFIFFTVGPYMFCSAFLPRSFSGKQILYAAIGGLFAVASVEAVQLFIVSRGTSVSNFVFGSAGIFHGLLWFKKFRPNTTRFRAMRLFFTFNYTIFFIFNYFFPFRLADTFSSNISWYSIIPFASYFVTISMSSIADLIAQILLFLPIGCYLARNKHLSLFRIFSAGCIVALICELPHCAIATRFCDITDVISGGTGCALGYYWTHRFFALRTALKHTAVSQQPAL